MFYTYYVKAEGKYYFGSRTNKVNLKRAAKDDFMIHYFTSSKDERLKEIIRNKEYEKAEIIKEYTDRQECLKDEESLIKNFWWLYGTENCWNHYADGKFSMSGIPLSEEHKQKVREAHIGKTHSEESKKQMSEAKIGENNPMYGKHMSDEAKEKISGENNPMYGKHMSDEAKEKMSEARKKYFAENPNARTGENNPMYGKHMSDEAKEKAKQTIANKTPEERAATNKKISEANKIRHSNKTPEERAATNKKISESNKGKLKPKYQWQTPEGEIIIMAKVPVIRFHPDWTFIGPVES